MIIACAIAKTSKVTLQPTEMAAQTADERVLNICVIGKIGTGKSALVNSIARQEIVRERYELRPTTEANVDMVVGYIENVIVNVWDYPGFQAGTEHETVYLVDLEQKYANTAAFLYCISMCDPHYFDWNQDVKVMNKLTQTLGTEMWNRTIIVLTFANDIIAEVKEKFDNNMQVVKAQYETIFHEWKETINKMLQEQVGLSGKLIRSVPLAMAGHMKQPELLHDGTNCHWFDVLWTQVVSVADKPKQLGQDPHIHPKTRKR